MSKFGPQKAPKHSFWGLNRIVIVNAFKMPMEPMGRVASAVFGSRPGKPCYKHVCPHSKLETCCHFVCWSGLLCFTWHSGSNSATNRGVKPCGLCDVTGAVMPPELQRSPFYRRSLPLLHGSACPTRLYLEKYLCHYDMRS